MSVPIIWSDEANDDYVELLKYLDSEFGADNAVDFMEKIEEFEKNISTFPKMYPATKKNIKMRKAAISKRALVLYYIGDNGITIISLIDARQSSWRF